MPSLSDTETPILVVDDCKEQRNLLRHTLAKKDYAVQVAADGAEALERIHERKPRLIFSDIYMPGMDGFELCRSLKANPSLRDVSVVLLSATWEMKTLIQGLESGADFYFLKPWDRRFLLSWTGEILKEESLQVENGENGKLVVQYEGKSHNIPLSRQQMLNQLLMTHDLSMHQKRQNLTRELKPDHRNGFYKQS